MYCQLTRQINPPKLLLRMTTFLPFLIGHKIYFHFLEKQLNISMCFLHDLLYNNRPVHLIKKALRKCFRERANFHR
jgi:hypothetical protein